MIDKLWLGLDSEVLKFSKISRALLLSVLSQPPLTFPWKEVVTFSGRFFMNFSIARSAKKMQCYSGVPTLLDYQTSFGTFFHSHFNI